ncbi:Alpha/Beta hydrolase protein [Aspergillus cavernicola]|uniref:Alpha/Beta hydrolase protein n=1 Tax=Aspergillus cavernicola TaxID=176166 RepID=A0ABR4HVS8_9EURO
MPKHLPSPTHSFTIPSIYDGIQLACRVYLPQQLLDTQVTSQWRVRGAIIAHPYASLGGCYDDPVVSFIGAELLDADYLVGTFNFRGAGDSEGRTSWTAKPELADYVSFYGFMMLYLQYLRLKIAFRPDSESIAGRVHLILGGYSYGSMVASHLPSSEIVADLFNDGAKGTPAHEIFLTARTICTLSEDEISQLQQPASTTPSTTHTAEAAEDVLKSSNTTTSYLLVSPLLPPINLFLTLFSDISLEVNTHASGQHRYIPCPKPTDQLCAHRTLAIYGDEDTFTSVGKLRKWSAALKSVPQSRFLSTEIEGAGHFWREEGAEPQARRSLRMWLHQQP